MEVLGSDLNLHSLLALLLEWEEVWLIAVCCDAVVIAFDDG